GTATRGYVPEVYARLLPQQLHREVTDTAGAYRCVAQRARFGLCRGDHIGECLEWLLRIRRQHMRRGADELHRVEVLLGVERQVGKNKGICRVIVEHHGPGASIMRRLCDRRSADASAP